MSHTNSTSHYSLPQFVGTDIPTWLGDFNSAMTAIDSGINAAATSASGAATAAAAAQKSANDAATDAAAAQKSANDALKAANRCPFPIGYGGFFQTDPNSIYAGTTWEQKKDVFILAAGDTYQSGSTGGEAQHTHKYGFQYGSYYGSISMEEDAHSGVLQGGTGEAAGSIRIEGDTEGKINSSNVENAKTILITHYKSIADTSSAINMPPYFAMPFWVRTA